jgi:hypothetical protein
LRSVKHAKKLSGTAVEASLYIARK